MSPRSDAPGPSEPKTFEPPPQRPPLEIVGGGAHWILEAYNQGRRDGETYSIHDSQMEALRAGKRRMDDRGHPCLLRWDSDESVGTMYWNPDFEHLEVRLDTMTETWVITPESGEIPFYTTDRQELAARYGRAVQQAYDFKHLDLYAATGTKRRSIDHRFVRNEIDASGIRFDREKIPGDPSQDPLEDEGDGESGVATSATPASALAAAVPDLTDVEVVLTEGPLRRYKAGWSDGGEAAIVALDPDRCDEQDAVDAFLNAVEDWSTIAENSHVATVYDDGIGPSPWVAFDAGTARVSEKIDDLDVRTRIDLADDIAAAYETAVLYDVPRRGAAPENVRLVATSGSWRATLADWGLTDAVFRALGESTVDHYTAPEEGDGNDNERTPIYHLGALTYYLATKQPPFDGVAALSEAIQRGDPDPPSSVADVPSALDDVILRAMAVDHTDRYYRISDFREALENALS